MSFVKIWSQFYSLLRKKRTIWTFIFSKRSISWFYSSFLERIKQNVFDKGNLFNGSFRSQKTFLSTALHVLHKLAKGSILVVYVSASCCPVLLVNSCVDLVVDDNSSTVWLSPSWLLVSGHDATTTIVAILF